MHRLSHRTALATLAAWLALRLGGCDAADSATDAAPGDAADDAAAVDAPAADAADDAADLDADETDADETDADETDAPIDAVPIDAGPPARTVEATFAIQPAGFYKDTELAILRGSTLVVAYDGYTIGPYVHHFGWRSRNLVSGTPIASGALPGAPAAVIAQGSAEAAVAARPRAARPASTLGAIRLTLGSRSRRRSPAPSPSPAAGALAACRRPRRTGSRR